MSNNVAYEEKRNCSFIRFFFSPSLSMRINLYQPYYYYVFQKLTVALSNNARSSYKNDDMSRKRWSFADVSWLNVITGYERDCWMLSTFLNSTDIPVEYKRLGSGNHSASIHNTQYNIRPRKNNGNNCCALFDRAVERFRSRCHPCFLTIVC